MAQKKLLKLCTYDFIQNVSLFVQILFSNYNAYTDKIIYEFIYSLSNILDSTQSKMSFGEPAQRVHYPGDELSHVDHGQAQQQAAVTWQRKINNEYFIFRTCEGKPVRKKPHGNFHECNQQSRGSYLRVRK